MKLRILLYDAYTLALESICETMKKIHDFEIVGAFSNCEDLVACLKEQLVDVVVLNLMLKSCEELETVRQIKSIQEQVKIIVLMDQKEGIIYERALEMGVNAFLRKDTSYSELISDIINVAKGNDIIPDALVSESVDTILSETEMKVLKMMVYESTNEEIAKKMFISRRTVESHVSDILQKLGVSSRAGAVREAVRLKLVQ
jgi:two-component system vancomycin resistance associated response regulator VraR